MNKNNTRPCPVCGKEVTQQMPDSPFCSSRCRQIDLGRWAAGDYRVEGESAMPWELENGED